jgi:peptidoglycan/LPS O-acetylase OafA/YrhL
MHCPAKCRLLASRGRIPVLDGLRGIAILLVLLYHGLFTIRFESVPLVRLSAIGKLSESGVDLFFVLSGFLIGGILLDVKDSPHYFKTFYVRRAYRILPLYMAVLGICLLRLISFHLFPDWFGSRQPKNIPFLSYVFFFQNFWMAFLGSFGLAFLSPTWSLAVGEQFYLTVPPDCAAAKSKYAGKAPAYGDPGRPTIARLEPYRVSQREPGGPCSYALSRGRALPGRTVRFSLSHSGFGAAG